MCYFDARAFDQPLGGIRAETRDGSWLQFHSVRQARLAVEQFALRRGLLEGSSWTADGRLLDGAGRELGRAGTFFGTM